MLGFLLNLLSLLLHLDCLFLELQQIHELVLLIFKHPAQGIALFGNNTLGFLDVIEGLLKLLQIVRQLLCQLPALNVVIKLKNLHDCYLVVHELPYSVVLATLLESHRS